MAEPAIRRMTLEEFLRWDDGTDTHYELIDGFPVAMAPPAEAHRILAVRLVSRIDAALAGRRPCNAQIEPGVVRPDRPDSYYVPDIAVTCEPNEPGRQAMVDPILIVEILSPSTERTDRRLKLPIYQAMESVREIMLIDADSHHAELYRRENDRWGVQLVRGTEASLVLTTVDLRISMSELYEGIAIAAATVGS
ncbi:MAG TPA: Uma2 family endonuclease [Stellaceae bacterium]|jgi:Uma2 family endonuclease|nr:Uma2 family endonuclease [Stellaceae bacterium]